MSEAAMKRARPRRLSAAELELALAFKLIVTRPGCQIHDDPVDCEGPIQAAHLIPKQALRRRGFSPEVIWDPRNGIAACYCAHRRSDAGLERFPSSRLPVEAWAFAEEVGLGWMLEKLYLGKVAA